MERVPGRCAARDPGMRRHEHRNLGRAGEGRPTRAGRLGDPQQHCPPQVARASPSPAEPGLRSAGLAVTLPPPPLFAWSPSQAGMPPMC